MLEGAKGGDGRLPMPMGEGGTRGEDCTGREWRDESGDGLRSEGEGEGMEGDPVESVDDLNGCTGLMLGRRMGRGPGAEGRS
jgi:hypothetical protein